MYACSLSATLTFAEAAEAYMRMRSVDAAPGAVTSARFLKPNTVHSYEQYIRSLNLFFGPMVLGTIHLGHIREYQMARLEGREPFIRKRRPHEAARPLPCKPPQINKELCLLKMVLRRANAWSDEMDQFAENLQEDGNEIPRALTLEEQGRWLEVSRMRERWEVVHWYSIVAFDTTCSTNELRGLRVGDVNLHHQTVNIPWPASKNRYRHRSIAIENADALWALERLLERARRLGASEPQHYLFPFWIPAKNQFDPSRPMTVTGFKKKWEEVRRATGLTWFRRADTRHTACTRLAENGVPTSIIMARSGHQSPRMLQHYTHISESAQRRWLQRPLTPGPVAPRPIQAPLYVLPRALETQPQATEERPGYKTIYIGGVPISIPA